MDNQDEFWLKQMFGTKEPDKPKPRKKPPKYPLAPEVLERYNSAHLQWFKGRFPSTYKDGHYLEPKIPDYQTANGLQTWIVNYMDWSGGDGNRINTMGVVRDGKYTKGSTKKGTGDLSCIHPCGAITFYLEIKVGKDTPREDQLKRQKKIQGMGGTYEFVKTPMDFFAVYDRIEAQSKFKKELF